MPSAPPLPLYGREKKRNPSYPLYALPHNAPFITGSNAFLPIWDFVALFTGRFIEVTAFPAQRLAVNRFLLELIVNIDEID